MFAFAFRAFSGLLFCAQQVKDGQHDRDDIVPRQLQAVKYEAKHGKHQQDHAQRAALRQLVLQPLNARDELQYSAQAADDDGNSGNYAHTRRTRSRDQAAAQDADHGGEHGKYTKDKKQDADHLQQRAP